MEDFDVSKWVDLFSTHPVLFVAVLGMVCGSVVTQLFKQLWLAYGNPAAISRARYRVDCMLLSMAVTWWLTHYFFEHIVAKEGHGLGKVTALITAIICPYAYKGVKSIVQVRWPRFAEAMGDSSERRFKATPSAPPGDAT